MTLKKELKTQGNWLFRYRSFLPIVIILPGLYLFLIADHDVYSYLLSYKIGVVISIIGIIIRAIAVGYSAPNTSGRNTTQGQIADSINSSGIYSLSRHPLYLGNYLMWLGLALLTWNLWFCIRFTLLFWLYYERIMFAEEDFLVAKFGSVYEDWATQTAAFIPKLSKWKKPSRPYSWTKVFYQEKSTWLNLALVLMVFYVSKDFYLGREFSQLSKFSVIVFSIVLLYYIVVKIIQKTKVSSV
jgi:protein-S-isoprenylcysteine O-methyltransferase Ste14